MAFKNKNIPYRVNLVNYTVDDGLAQNQAIGLFQDDGGYLWIGTNGGGVSRFDGNRFVTLSKKNGLADNVVFAINQDTDGNLLFGTKTGLSVYDGFTCKNILPADSSKMNMVNTIYKDKSQQIWIGSTEGLYKYENHVLKKFTGDSLLASAWVYTFYESPQGKLWVGTLNRGLYSVDKDEVRNYNIASGLNDMGVRTIIEDDLGRLWVGTQKGLNYLYKEKFYTHLVDTSADNYNLSVTASAKDKAGNIWFASLGGLYKYDGDSVFSRYSGNNGLITDKIWSLYIDKEENLWLGTYCCGIERFGSEAFINYYQQTGLSSSDVKVIFEDTKGSFWIGTDNGLNKMANDKLMTYTRTNIKSPKIVDAPIRNVWSVMECKDGRLFFGSRPGLTVFDGKNMTLMSDKYPALKELAVFSMIEMNNGEILLGTSKGLYTYNGNEFLRSEKPDAILGKKNYSIPFIYKDNKENIWLCTDNGLLLSKKETFYRFSSREGFMDGRVTSICMDSQGYYWIATDEGVYRYDSGKEIFDHISDDQGLASNKIYLLATDDYANLWVGTNRGLDKLDIAEFNNTGKIKVEHYAKAEGFIGVECNSNAVCKDSKGKLWFGTSSGVTVYNPSNAIKNSKEPDLKLAGIKLFLDENTDLSSYCSGFDRNSKLPINLILPASQNHVTFDFVGISLTIPGKVKYQYMLEGFDKDWLPVTGNNNATYTLPPGSYTFLLKAMNNDGLWNREPLAFSFVVSPPWYKTIWFYILCAFVLAGSTYLTFVLRTRNLRRAKAILEQKVEFRTRELREEKEKVEMYNKEVLFQKNIIEEKNRDITDSINYAKRIQEAVLPSLTDIDGAFNDVFVLFKPKDIVSGDFYWFAHKDDKVFIAVVDCTGHGVPGAFMSMIGNNLMNQIILEKGIFDPSRVLYNMNSGIKEAFRRSHREMDTKDGMDMALCVIDKGSGKIMFSGAMRPLYHVRAGVLTEIKGNKAPIGSTTDESYIFDKNEFELVPGDIFYISSDGFADQFGGDKGKKLMTKFLKHFLLEIHKYPMKKQKQKLEEYLETWRGDNMQVDDVLLIGFRV